MTTAHVAAVLAAVEVGIRCMPLPRLSRLLRVRIDLEPATSEGERLRLGELPPRARRQLRCTWRVADLWPFSKGPCLRRALVGAHLIRRHDPAIRLGLTGAGDTLVGHAWIEIDHRAVLEPSATYSRFEADPARAAG